MFLLFFCLKEGVEEEEKRKIESESERKQARRKERKSAHANMLSFVSHEFLFVKGERTSRLLLAQRSGLGKEANSHY